MEKQEQTKHTCKDCRYYDVFYTESTYLKKRHGCDSKFWKKDILEETVIDAILKTTSTKENLDYLLDKIMAKHNAMTE